jgi:hypothetical protein
MFRADCASATPARKQNRKRVIRGRVRFMAGLVQDLS